MVTALESERKTLDARMISARVGWLGLVLVFACSLWSPPLLYLGLLLAMGGIALDGAFGRTRLLAEPIAWVVTCLAIWVGVRGWIDLQTAAARGLEPDPEAIWHHVRYSGIVPLVLGAWMARWWYRRWVLLACLCVGLIGYCISVWPEIVMRMPIGRMHHGSYPEMGLISATGTGLSLGLFCAYRRLNASARMALTRPLMGIAAIAFVLTLTALIFSRVRSSWLAMLLALAIGLAFAAYHVLAATDSRTRKRLFRNALLVVAVAATLLVAFRGYFVGRVTAGEDLQTVTAITTGNFGPENEGSFARRYRMLHQGLADIAANPVWGIGPASVRDMLDFAVGRRVDGQGDYHNTYVNLAVAMGIPWALLWIAFHIGIVGRAGYVLWRVEREPALAFALLAASLVHAIDLSFQVRIWNVDGSAMYIILMTVAFATLLRRRWQTGTRAPTDVSISSAYQRGRASG